MAYLLPKYLLPKPKETVILDTLYGFQMIIDPVKDNGVERSIYYTGTYEKGTLYILKNILKEGDVFVDVGANIGLMSILASQVVSNSGKVFAFEPNPNTLEILKKNIELNEVSNIEASSYAIGSKIESSKIYDRWNANRGSASLIKPDYETTSYDINVIRLTDYFETRGEKITAIKLDIEGYELEALKGALEILKKMSPMLIIECSDVRENLGGADKNALFDFILNANDYNIYKLKGSKARKSKLIQVTQKHEMPEHDNIFCFTKEHLKHLPKRIFKSHSIG